MLFHGTSSEFVEAICIHNFDWRINGMHAAVYGKGKGLIDFFLYIIYLHIICSGMLMKYFATRVEGPWVNLKCSSLAPCQEQS